LQVCALRSVWPASTIDTLYNNRLHSATPKSEKHPSFSDCALFLPDILCSFVGNRKSTWSIFPPKFPFSHFFPFVTKSNFFPFAPLLGS
jgi:hypothetical protein